MKKSELLQLLDELSTIDYYANNSNFKLISKLLKAYDEDAEELEAITKNIARQVIELLLDCFTSSDLIEWLDKNDWDVFYNIQHSEIVEYDELDEDELEEILNNNDYLFNDEEEEILILSW